MIGTHQDLRDELPGVKIVQVIHVQDVGSIDEAGSAAETADALLLDSGKPSGAVKVLGGTGKVHNWEISRHIVDAVTIPVFLAGGLNASNVAAAIKQVRPFGVDICSGVRTDGVLDEDKLRAFVEAVG
jgi:phosphoribosylanthranilate isomerase